MSTRCLIGITENIESDKMTCVYCQHDGYPDGVGVDLHCHYDTEEKIRKMMEGGDMSALRSTPEKCDYYNEEDSAAAPCRIKLPLGKTDIEYCYAFDLSTSIWWVWTVYKQSLEKLSDVLKELKVL